MRKPRGESDLLGLIHDAIGRPDLWQQLELLIRERSLEPELGRFLEAALQAHREATSVARDIAQFNALCDQLAVGVIVCNAEGTPLSINMEARRYLQDERGLTLVGGRLRATESFARAAWNRAWREMTEVRTDSVHDAWPRVVPLLRRGTDSVSVVVLRSPHATEGVLDSGKVTLLVLGPSARAAVSPDLLRMVFGLTVRQSELASLLASGCVLDEAARSLGIANTTARTLLAQLMARTESSTRAGLLVRLLAVPHLSLPAGYTVDSVVQPPSPAGSTGT